jgi:hypothetical protein
MIYFIVEHVSFSFNLLIGHSVPEGIQNEIFDVNPLRFGRFEIFNEVLHVLQIVGEGLAPGWRDPVGGFWPQRDESLFASNITTLFQFAQMEVQAAVNGVEPFFQRCKIQRPVYLQRCHNAQSNGPMHSGIESVKINRLHTGVRGSGFDRLG